MMFEIPITEFKNLKIGNMENIDAGTGCTVFLFEKGARPDLMYGEEDRHQKKASC